MRKTEYISSEFTRFGVSAERQETRVSQFFTTFYALAFVIHQCFNSFGTFHGCNCFLCFFSTFCLHHIFDFSLVPKFRLEKNYKWIIIGCFIFSSELLFYISIDVMTALLVFQKQILSARNECIKCAEQISRLGIARRRNSRRMYCTEIEYHKLQQLIRPLLM